MFCPTKRKEWPLGVSSVFRILFGTVFRAAWGFLSFFYELVARVLGPVRGGGMGIYHSEQEFFGVGFCDGHRDLRCGRALMST